MVQWETEAALVVNCWVTNHPQSQQLKTTTIVSRLMVPRVRNSGISRLGDSSPCRVDQGGSGEIQQADGCAGRSRVASLTHVMFRRSGLSRGRWPEHLQVARPAGQCWGSRFLTQRLTECFEGGDGSYQSRKG